MGLDYAFELAVDRSAVDLALVAIGDFLIPADRERLLRCVPVDPADPLGRFARTPLDVGLRPVCLSFLFSPDGALNEWGETCGVPAVDGKVRAGCVWSTLEVGSKVAVFRALAATTDMSLLFERSASVRAAWASIAVRCDALVLLLDDEQYENRAVWPVDAVLGHPPRDEAGMDGNYLALAEEARRLRAGGGA